MDLGFPPLVPGAGPDAGDDDAAARAADIVGALAELAQRHGGTEGDGAVRPALTPAGGAFNAVMAARLTAWKKG